jgi:predicted transcriptional regulator
MILKYRTIKAFINHEQVKFIHKKLNLLKQKGIIRFKINVQQKNNKIIPLHLKIKNYNINMKMTKMIILLIV